MSGISGNCGTREVVGDLLAAGLSHLSSSTGCCGYHGYYGERSAYHTCHRTRFRARSSLAALRRLHPNRPSLKEYSSPTLRLEFRM